MTPSRTPLPLFPEQEDLFPAHDMSSEEMEFVQDFGLEGNMGEKPLGPAKSVQADQTEKAFDAEFKEICTKCHGKGYFRNCFTCKGAGFKVFKTPPEARAKKAASRVAAKIELERNAWAYFSGQHPEIATWIEENQFRFDFARSMYEAVLKYGELTDRQLSACENCMNREQEKAKAQERRAAEAPVVQTDKLMECFNKAKVSGLKNPKMRFDGFQTSLAGPESRNAGAVYVKTGTVYQGKIQNGKFFASRDCSPDVVAKVQEAMVDPLASAVAYGMRTGNCSCCGMLLTNKISVERGIGPICAEKFGL